jgi:hypothetical protein
VELIGLDPDTVHDLARRLERAVVAGPEVFRRTLGDLYAGSVELRHEPPLAADRVVDGRRLAASTETEAAAIAKAIADQRYGGAEVTVDGRVVVVKMALTGRLADGRSVGLPTHMRCAVDNGRIVAITHVIGPDAMRAWTEVAVAGGLMPAEKLPTPAEARE